MKQISFIIKTMLPGLLATVLVMPGCTPNERDVELGPLPQASFTATPITGMVNRYLLTSTSKNTTQWRWDNGDGSEARNGKEIDTAYFPSMGTYRIKLLAMSRGGIDSAFQTVTVAADDPNGCVGLKAALTACSSRVWKLKPDAGSLIVGPVGLGSVWWQNTAVDVTLRSCTFNDRYTFTVGGSFVFDNKGDMWIEDEGGNPWPTDIGGDIGCHPMTDIAAKYQAWGSGNHTFTLIGNSRLRVNGTGAFMGIYKVGDNDNAAVPQTSITYDVIEYSDTKLVIRKTFSWGAWQFSFVPE